MTRAKQIALKAAVIFGGAVMLVSAFVMSLVFFVIALAVVLVFGGYLWWKTRELRRQMRARVQEQRWQQSGGRVIEGEVISDERTRR
jgi:ABC-type bacteriocin/lantibiotic exporter with double-glycine peptidase domain